MMKKRFIAGAVCPKCAAVDRLVMFEEDGETIRECVECGFTDIQRNQEVGQDNLEELKTRVNQGEYQANLDSEDIQPIKILN
ncbi:YheV family putative metal-binding protein [Sansalvadorimonas sp. 2012CJ34-2]|uniref:YheV family putative metal-binding protein n=1 Tax=Parendozoicomonas callyspongiae TaxID=2942213 RepID=A0ABT0PAS5_9GAMM|nr:YheV family putative zinc ribbon protein [Sansalvadorimonas sp. 2012CJ34-2]MCL6268494.1 YheV family putative metal-binding protein [Sansalvadorimonas sp. 2012CJ34-2]